MGFGDRIRAFARPWELASFLWVPAIALAYASEHELRARDALQNFAIFRTAAKTVLHGGSPYVAANAQALAGFDKFVYPPVTAFLFAPFAVVPLEAARVLMLAAGLAAVLGALYLLEVEDWRCYGVAVMTAPVVNSLALGALSSFLLLGVAATWRYRDRPRVAGPVAALTIVTKLFLWPLGVWLFAVRRIRALAWCAFAALVLVGGGWAAIGFAGARTYPRTLRILEQIESHVSYGPLALFHLSSGARSLLSAVLAVIVVAAVVTTARSRDGERRSLAVAIVGALVVSPLLWLHYLVLLFVPLALYRPRLSGLWFVPLALWLTPSSNSHGETWRVLLVLAVVAVVVARTVLATRRQRPSLALVSA